MFVGLGVGISLAGWRPGLPTLDMNFTGASALDSRVTFTRSSDGTYYDADGVLQTASSDEARLDHDADGDPLGLLLEGSRTNLALRSEGLNHTDWSTFNSTVTANDRDAPDGSASADKIDNTAGQTDGNINNSRDIGTIAGNSYTTSVWVYTTDGHTVTLRMRGNGTTQEGEDFHFETVANEWTRIEATKAFTGSADGTVLRLFIYPGEKDVAQGVAWYWGVQTEEAAFASSYSVTFTSTTTRAADVAEIDDLTWLNAAAGTMVIEATPLGLPSGNRTVFALHDDNNNAIWVDYNGTGGGLRCNVKEDGTDHALISSGSGIVSAGTTFRAALAWATDDVAFYVDGEQIGTDSSATIPAITDALKLTGVSGLLSSPFHHVRRLTYYPARLPNAQLQGLTG